MYALVDCNNFFVSCERVFRPDLEGKPVVVMSGNDGCIIARSNEAKALGLKMGAPVFQVRDLVEREGVQCFSSNFSLYGDLSSRVMTMLSRHTDTFQQYSIDEAFLRLDHLKTVECKPYCEQIVRDIRRGIGIPVSIGIAPTKTLAKIASKYAKKYPGYHGVCQISTDEQRLKALACFPIEDVWGIGRRNFRRLAFEGVRTAGDFAAKSETWVGNMFSKPGVQTWLELCGYDVIAFSELPEKKSMTVSRTFSSAISDRTKLEGELCNFMASCCRKLRAQHSVCAQFVVFVGTSRFAEGGANYLSGVVTPPVPTSNLQELLGYMLMAFRRQFMGGVPYKRGGVIMTQLMDENAVQADLFDVRDRAKDERLQNAIDSLNARFGKEFVRFVSQSPDNENYKTCNLSPRYSTRLDDIVVVKS